jgi:hypothetical protein
MLRTWPCLKPNPAAWPVVHLASVGFGGVVAGVQQGREAENAAKKWGVDGGVAGLVRGV